MTGFLQHLVERTLAAPALVQPRLPSRFEQPLDSAAPRASLLAPARTDERAGNPPQPDAGPLDTEQPSAPQSATMRPQRTADTSQPNAAEATSRPQAPPAQPHRTAPASPWELQPRSQPGSQVESEPGLSSQSLPVAPLSPSPSLPPDQEPARDAAAAARSLSEAQRRGMPSSARADQSQTLPPAAQQDHVGQPSRLPPASPHTERSGARAATSRSTAPQASTRGVAVEPLVHRSARELPPDLAGSQSLVPVPPAPLVPPNPAAQTERRAAPTIQVTIGRVDVRAVFTPAPAPPPPSPRPAPALSLDDYLKQRDGGGT